MTKQLVVSKPMDVKKFWKSYGAVILKYGLVPVSESNIGIGGSTFRVYGRFVKHDSSGSPRARPKKLLMQWIKLRFRDLELHAKRDYEKFHKTARESLCDYWTKHPGGAELDEFPYACKLLDLRVKHLVWHRIGMTESQQERLLFDAYQPLDTYSLKLLRILGLKQQSGDELPDGASMGYVRSKAEYLHLQKQIGSLCQTLRIPAFAFDQVAWNSQA